MTGEAGIGKTTLVEAFAAATAGRGGAGAVPGAAGRPEPYLPVFDALDRLCRDDAEALAWLSRLAPTWLAQMPALVGEADREDLERRALGGTQLRMLREAAEALEAIGAERPLALVLEDLHWADPSTVDLLDWLARRDIPARLLLVGTYRPADALAGGAPIAAVAAELRLRGLATELPLAELGRRRWPPCWAAGSPAPRSPRSWPGWCTGAPTGCRCSWSSSPRPGPTRARCARPPAAGSWPPTRRGRPEVPDDLRRLLELQLDRLDPADLAMLEAAAVGGVEFAAATAAGAEPEAAATVEAVEGRCAALARPGRFLRATGPVAWSDGTVSAGFRFAHDLHRTVLYDRIPAGRRARLHAAVAQRLERAYGPDAPEQAAELASQFLGGHDHPRAAGYLQAAAAQALGRSAHREAIQQLELLLATLPRLPEGAPGTRPS